MTCSGGTTVSSLWRGPKLSGHAGAGKAQEVGVPWAAPSSLCPENSGETPRPWRVFLPAQPLGERKGGLEPRDKEWRDQPGCSVDLAVEPMMSHLEEAKTNGMSHKSVVGMRPSG